jgi:hypothetical protein
MWRALCECASGYLVESIEIVCLFAIGGVLDCGEGEGFKGLVCGTLQASSAKAISKEILDGRLTIQSLVSELPLNSVSFEPQRLGV